MTWDYLFWDDPFVPKDVVERVETWKTNFENCIFKPVALQARSEPVVKRMPLMQKYQRKKLLTVITDGRKGGTPCAFCDRWHIGKVMPVEVLETIIKGESDERK